MRRLGPKEFEKFANCPVMLREQGGTGAPLDNSWFYVSLMNVALEEDGGCMAFVYLGSSSYDAHFLFPRYVRGKRAVISAKAMLHHMLTVHEAARIVANIRPDDRKARFFARQIGMEFEGMTDVDGSEFASYAKGNT